MPLVLKNFVRYSLIALVFLAMAPICHAGYVTIQTQMGAQVAGKRLEVIAKIANLGNAPANEVSAVLDVLGHKRKGQLLSPENVAVWSQKGGVESLLEYTDVRLRKNGDSLGPGEAVVFKYSLDLSESTLGSYPAILHIEYKDENSLPFFSLAGIVFKTPGAPLPKLKAAITEKRKNGAVVMAVNLSNASDHTIQVQANLALPEALACQDPNRNLKMASGGQTALEFVVENLTDRQGTHAVFCVLEYQDGQTHHAVLAASTLEITPRPHWFSRTRPWWIGLDAILICLFLGAWGTVWRFQNS
ncbi:MAG: hypothetical protein JEZ02_17760 [Desulfatibacillum sp.]|nr:hypothetical protein [Desulfatibacillum sp.]